MLTAPTVHVEPSRGPGRRRFQALIDELDVHDPADAPALGVARSRAPSSIRGRLVVVSSGLEAQVALIEPDPLPGPGGPAALDVLPEVVPAHALGRVATTDDSVVGLRVGLDFTTLSTAALRLPIGEHVVVLGPARSGRSSALIRLIEAWREQRGARTLAPGFDDQVPEQRAAHGIRARERYT